MKEEEMEGGFVGRGRGLSKKSYSSKRVSTERKASKENRKQANYIATAGPSCGLGMWLSLMLAILVLLSVPSVEGAQKKSSPRCQQLAFALFRDCGGVIGRIATNITLTDVCCQMSKEANDANCYCDQSLLQAGESVGVTATSVASSLFLLCGVPQQDINVYDKHGCVSVPSPSRGGGASKDCPQLILSLYVDCNTSLSTPFSDLTRDGACCRLTKLANDERCFCDVELVEATKRMGVTTGAILTSLTLYCQVPRDDVRLLNFQCEELEPSAPPPAVAMPDPELCKSLAFSLYGECVNKTETSPAPDSEQYQKCCGKLMQANDAYCFCDTHLLASAGTLGISAGSIDASLALFCGVAVDNIHVPGRNCNVIPAPAPVPALSTPVVNPDLQHCQDLMFSLLRRCPPKIARNALSNQTQVSECCEMSKQANDAYCFCDAGLLGALESLGMSSNSIGAGLVLTCDVALDHVNLYGFTTCTSSVPTTAPVSLSTSAPGSTPIPARTILTQGSPPAPMPSHEQRTRGMRSGIAMHALLWAAFLL